MTTDQEKYYRAYEDRYRRVYGQGVDYWTADPDEIATVIKHLNQFFQDTGITPGFGSIVEFGCGEGFLAEYLLSKGYSYLGIDLSPSALEKARHRVRGYDSKFILGDITDLSDIQADSFDIGLDNFCLHMLVTDEDREKYLAEIHRVLKSSGRVWFHEMGQASQFREKIKSFEDFLAKHPMDLDTCEARPAYTPQGVMTVYLPRLCARFNNCDGYREEIEKAGLKVDLVKARASGIVIYARKVD